MGNGLPALAAPAAALAGAVACAAGLEVGAAFACEAALACAVGLTCAAGLACAADLACATGRACDVGLAAVFAAGLRGAAFAGDLPGAFAARVAVLGAPLRAGDWRATTALTAFFEAAGFLLADGFL